MNLTKFQLTESQFLNFFEWVNLHYTVPPSRLRGDVHPLFDRDLFNMIQLFLGRHHSVQLLNWRDRTFVTTQPAAAGFFVLNMSKHSVTHAQ